MLKALIVSTLCVISFSACNKRVCQDPNSPCSDTPPTDEACAAYFERWFYNSSSNTCTLVPYNGCNEKGFATETACINSCVTGKHK